jgi:hypothetical protein
LRQRKFHVHSRQRLQRDDGFTDVEIFAEVDLTNA